jgi:hypothetical protein
MRIIVTLMVVSITGVLAIWQIGAAPTAVEAASNVVITELAAQPAPVKAGQTLTIATAVQARTRAMATVEVAAVTTQGAVWRTTWASQRLARGQTQPLTAAWAIPTTLPSDVYTLVVSVRDANGAELARVRELKVQIAPPDAAAPAPAPPDQQQAPPGAAIAHAAYPFPITGSASFVNNVVAGLELMRATAPADFEVVRTHVTEIREGPRNWSWGGSRVIQISTTSAAHSRTYAGSIILHEAVHVKNWFTNDLPVFGCDGEAKSLRAQSTYLRAAGDHGMAQWVEGLIGNWC